MKQELDLQDMELQIFEGSSIDIYNSEQHNKYICSVHPKTLREIVKLKYSKYNLMLTNLIAKPEQFGLKNDVTKTFSTYNIIVNNMIYGDDEYRIMIIEALELFLCEPVSFVPQFGQFYIGEIEEDRVINEVIFGKIVDVLRMQNCDLTKSEDTEFKNCANSKAEEIKRKILKGRQSLVEKKDNLTFKDLISVLAANGNGINMFNIWDLTLYSFNNQFARMQMIEEYNMNFRSLLAGAKSEDIDLKHYIRSINQQTTILK